MPARPASERQRPAGDALNDTVLDAGPQAGNLRIVEELLEPDPPEGPISVGPAAGSWPVATSRNTRFELDALQTHRWRCGPVPDSENQRDNVVEAARVASRVSRGHWGQLALDRGKSGFPNRSRSCLLMLVVFRVPMAWLMNFSLFPGLGRGLSNCTVRLN